MDLVVRALIGGGVGVLIAVFANVVVLPWVLKVRQKTQASYDHLPAAIRWMAESDRQVKFVYRFVMPVLFTFVFAFAAVKLGEPS